MMELENLNHSSIFDNFLVLNFSFHSTLLKLNLKAAFNYKEVKILVVSDSDAPCFQTLVMWKPAILHLIFARGISACKAYLSPSAEHETLLL